MMKACLGLLVVGWISSGCVSHNNSVCDANLYCPDPSRSFCDLDGAIAGTPNTCIAVSCTANEFGACRGEQELTCNAAGDGYELADCPDGCNNATGCAACVAGTTSCGADGNVLTCSNAGTEEISQACAAGCTATPAPHCAYLEPNYLPDICDQPASADSLTIYTDTILDSSDSATCNGGILAQASGSPICVIRYRSISIASGAKVSFSLSADDYVSVKPAIALVADDLVDIEGTVDAGSHPVTGSGVVRSSGPGGGSIASGIPLNDTATGGGGAGGSTAGGGGCSGVQGTGSETSTLGGAAVAGGITSTVLRGGARSGGGGGGAITLVACRGKVKVSGRISANGGAGFVGLFENTSTPGEGATGGGAGGVVALQGLEIELTGNLFANGGGGGAGGNTGYSDIGEDGHNDQQPASGGAGGGAGINEKQAGGNGGTGTQAPTNGSCSATSFNNPAPPAGGGSVGYSMIFVPPLGTIDVTSAGSSPFPSGSKTSATR